MMPFSLSSPNFIDFSKEEMVCGLWVSVWWAADKWCGCAAETQKEEMGYRCFGDMKETGMFGGVCCKWWTCIF